MKLMAKKQLLVTVLILSMVAFFALPLTAFATNDTFEVTYNEGGGDPSQSYLEGAEVIIAEFGTVPNGKAFLGWKLNGNDTDLFPDGYDESHIYLPGDKIKMPANNLNFKAILERAKPVPGIDILKSVSATTVSALDAEVTYTFDISNTGDIDFNNVVVSDEAIAVNLELGALAAGDTTTAAVKFDLGNLGTEGYGKWTGDEFTNIATVYGYYGEGKDKSDYDEATVVYVEPPEPSIIMEKSVNPTIVTTKAIDVTYTFTVTNGAVALSGVKIADELLGKTINIGDMEPNQVFTTDVAINLGSLDEKAWKDGKLTNTAEVYDKGELVSYIDDATIVYNPDFTPDPKLSIDKKVRLVAENSLFSDELEVGVSSVNVLYKFTVENTGNVDLKDVFVYDQLLGLTSLKVDLPIGQSYSFFSDSYNISGDAWGDDKRVINIASASGIYNENPVDSPTDSAIVEYSSQDNPEDPDIDLVKTVSSGSGFVKSAAVGSMSADVTYKFVVTNNGAYPLYNVSLEDDTIDYGWDIGYLGVDETTTASVTFDLGELGAGSWSRAGNISTFTNTATVFGNYEGPQSYVTSETSAPSVTDTDTAAVTYKHGGGGGGDGGNDEEIVPNDVTPAAPVEEIVPPVEVPAAPLPQTGGIPALLFFGAGSLIAGAGALLRRKEK